MPDLDRYQYGYDQNSNRVWKANVVGTPVVSGGLDEGYAYDNLNRLTQMQRGTLSGGVITGTPVAEQDWTLDPLGNWNGFVTKASGTTTLNQTRTQNPVNEITAIGGTPAWATPPAYDPAGNMTSFPQSASPSSAFTATYDAWNRLVSVSSSGTTVAEYQYDGANRRVVAETYSGGTLSETRHFYYTSNWQDIEERVGTSTSMDKQYVWGDPYIDELVCRDDATQRLYVTQDANFNVTAIVDTTGTVQERFLYDPYGNSTVLTGSWTSTTDSYAWTYRHQGGRLDPATRNYNFRNRDYSTVLSRWLSRDPIGYLSGENLYDYANNRPTGSRDPWGTNSCDSGGGGGGGGQYAYVCTCTCQFQHASTEVATATAYSPCLCPNWNRMACHRACWISCSEGAPIVWAINFQIIFGILMNTPACCNEQHKAPHN